MLKECGFINTDKINVYFTDTFEIEEENKGGTAEEIMRYVTFAASSTPHLCADAVAIGYSGWKDKNKEADRVYREIKS